MLKSNKTALKKGRWLVLEQTSHAKEEILAHIRAIDGAEIQVVETKTYVRFPEGKSKSVKPIYKFTKLMRQKRAGCLSENNTMEDPRQYCAVMLKNGR